MPARFVATSGTLQTNASSLTPIPGLSLLLPEGTDLIALVILNLPNPYAQGSDFPGGTFGIAVNGVVQPATAAFTYNEQQPQSTGRVPTTLVVGVPLIIGQQRVEGLWAGVRNSTVVIDSPASLSVVF